MAIRVNAWYRTPLAQVALVGECHHHLLVPGLMLNLAGVVFFATVGMFLAASNLGAGGTQDIALSDTSNGVLYGCFALMGLFAGGVTNCPCRFWLMSCDFH